jgi:hypothetical protein
MKPIKGLEAVSNIGPEFTKCVAEVSEDFRNMLTNPHDAPLLGLGESNHQRSCAVA